jgi:TetR/AcrR family transcriptional regulator
MGRNEQRDETRGRIVDAAIEAFAEHGYRASSTRDIAGRAGVTQGLITYHFDSKDALWRAAADRIFGQLDVAMPAGPTEMSDATRREVAREEIRAYVRFVAARPELFRFMVDAGTCDDERMSWLVQTHIARRFEEIARFAGVVFPGSASTMAPHLFYALAGAASLMFAVAPECIELTGVDPKTDAAVARHADLVADLFLP